MHIYLNICRACFFPIQSLIHSQRFSFSRLMCWLFELERRSDTQNTLPLSNRLLFAENRFHFFFFFIFVVQFFIVVSFTPRLCLCVDIYGVWVVYMSPERCGRFVEKLLCEHKRQWVVKRSFESGGRYYKGNHRLTIFHAPTDFWLHR